MSKTKKRIGISLRVENIQNHGEKRDAISQDWITLFEKLDIFPILIPNNLSNVKSFLTEMKVDGVVLSGGDNMGDDPERDRTEKEIIDFAINSHTPILGVCRGMQVLNHHFGGSIIKNSGFNHVGNPHKIELKNSIFSKLLRSDSLQVNSFHNNVINLETLGKNLEIFAMSNNDKTIEGYFHKTLPIIGVMWHPERDHNVQPELTMMKIFQDKLFWTK